MVVVQGGGGLTNHDDVNVHITYYKTILVVDLGVRKDNVINICGKRVIRNSVGLLFSKPCLLFVWISVPPFARSDTLHVP